MKRTIIAVAAAISCLTVLPAHAAKYPSPTGYVNDFAKIIPGDVQSKLEKQLAEFDTATSNQIAVVTVDSLNGDTIENYTNELFKEWGVGQKGKNNGVVILVAPNERKTRIETGRRSEVPLTDARAKLIIERQMIPRFKAGDFPGGITAGAQAVIGVLGSAVGTADDPAAATSESKGGCDGCGWIFLMVIGGIAGLVFFIFLGLSASRALRRKRDERERIDQFRVAANSVIGKAETYIAEHTSGHIQALILESTCPKRILDLRDTAIAELARFQEAVNPQIEAAKTELKSAPEAAHTRAFGANEIVREFDVNYITPLLIELEEYNVAKASYEHALSGAEGAIANCGTYLHTLVKDGYKLDPAKLLNKASAMVASAKEALMGPTVDYEALVASAEKANQLADAVKVEWQDRIKAQKDNAKTLQAITAWYDEFTKSGHVYLKQNAEKLRDETPVLVCGQVIESAGRAVENLVTNFPDMSAKVETLNSMSSQKFEDAEKQLAKLELLKHDAVEAVAAVGNLLEEFRSAKSMSAQLITDVESAVNRAKSTMNEPDANGAGRAQLNSATAKLAEANKQSKAKLVNWLIVASLLSEALDSANGARGDAEDAIQSAEEERQEEQRRARRRREEEEAAERRRRDDDNSYSSSSSWSSSSSSSDSGSSFGGFGGGDSGGGGASGGW